MSEKPVVNKPKKKKHTLLWIILLTPLLLVGIGFAMLSIPKQAKVDFTQTDLDSYLAKGGIILNENSASFEEIFAGKFQVVGKKEVEATVTSAEATAILNETLKEGSVFKNIRIKFVGENKVQASATITDDFSQIYTLVPEAQKYDDYLSTMKGKSVFIGATLSLGTDALFVAEIESLSVGSLPLPVDQANDYGTMLGTALNQKLSSIPNFEVESFKIDAEGLHFKGTIPQEVRSVVN